MLPVAHMIVPPVAVAIEGSEGGSAESQRKERTELWHFPL